MLDQKLRTLKKACGFFELTDEILKKNVKNVSDNECLTLFVCVKKIHTKESSFSRNNPWGKLVLILSDVIGCLASMRITF